MTDTKTPLTVAGLIEALSVIPPDTIIYAGTSSHSGTIDSVEYMIYLDPDKPNWALIIHE